MAGNAQANSLSGIQSAIDNYWSAVNPSSGSLLLSRQAAINKKWFDAARADENTRISHWSDNNKCGALAAPQEAIAKKASKATIDYAERNFQGQSNLLLAGNDYYSFVFQFEVANIAVNSNTFSDVPKPDSYTDEEWRVLRIGAKEKGIFYASQLRSGALFPLALKERGASLSSNQTSPPPLYANSAKPLQTRPKVYWLSRAILQCRTISGAGQTLTRNQRKALYDQKKSAKILAKAQTGFFTKGAKDINGLNLFDSAGRSLIATPKVVSRLAEICQKGYYSNTDNAWLGVSSQLNQQRQGLNALNTISANQASARNLGTKIQGMFAVPTAEIQLSDRNWQRNSQSHSETPCTPRSSE